MKKLLRLQLERARKNAGDYKATLQRFLPMVLRQYSLYDQKVGSLKEEIARLRLHLQEFSTDDRALRDQRLRAVVDNVKDGILTVDEDGVILSINLTGERIFGYQPGSLVGSHLSLTLPFPEDRTPAAYLRELATGSNRDAAKTSPMQVECRHLSGTQFPCDIVVSEAMVEDAQIFIVGVRDMTERVTAERALRESESRYRSLVDSAPEAIVVVDLDANRFVDFNEVALNMFRTDAETMRGWGPKDVSPERQDDGSESFGSVRGHLEAALDGRKPVFEWLHKDARGRVFPCEVRLARIVSGKRRLVRGSITNITERKRAEHLAAGEKDILEKIAANAPLSEVLDIVARTVEGVTGRARCAILLIDSEREHLAVGAAPNLPEKLIDAMDRLPVGALTAAPAPSKTLVETVIEADMGTDPLWGTHRELAISLGFGSSWSTPIRSSAGDLVGVFAVFYREKRVLVQKSFELFDRMTRLAGIAIERKLAEKAIRASERRFRGLFENVLDGVYQVSADGRFISANPALVKMLGFDSEEALKAIGPTTNLYVEPRDQSGVLETLHDEGQVRNAELRLRRADGSHIVVLENARVVRDAAGAIRGYEGTLSDITDRKRAELAVFEEKERAQVTLKSIADAVITTDARGRIDYLNPVAEHLTGWRAEEAAGRPVTEIVKIIHEGTGEDVENPVFACLRHGEVTELGQHSMLVSRDQTQVAIQDSAAPIRDHRSRVVGAVMVFHDVGKERRLRHQLAYQATHDSLTGLINRREFEVRLERALQNTRADRDLTHVLLYLDLDQFKIVNDTCGHSAGDQLLQQVTSLITRRVRASDVVCRLGGDEFGILLEDCNLERSVEIGNGLRQAIREYRFFWQEAVFDIGVSIGVVAMSGESDSVAALLSAADVACYAAKDSGRNRLHVYQHGDAAERHAEMQWVSRVTRALEDGRFELYYQPIVPISDIADRRAHYELLLRLRDETGALVPPDAFIPAAERYNLMPTLDRWVIRQALEGLVDSGRCGAADGYSLAINLSGTSLNDDKFLAYVLQELEAHELAPGALCFEITETAAISNLSVAAHFMSEIKRRGCEFSLDDFGSGLSSFTYLKNLPVDYLKIDGHFIKQITHDRIDQTMVKAITEVGNAMGIRTVAEHVETKEVLDTLRAIGVEYAQGYYFAKPAPVSDFRQLAPMASPRLADTGTSPTLRLV